MARYKRRRWPTNRRLLCPLCELPFRRGDQVRRPMGKKGRRWHRICADIFHANMQALAEAAAN